MSMYQCSAFTGCKDNQQVSWQYGKSVGQSECDSVHRPLGERLEVSINDPSAIGWSVQRTIMKYITS